MQPFAWRFPVVLRFTAAGKAHSRGFSGGATRGYRGLGRSLASTAICFCLSWSCCHTAFGELSAPEFGSTAPWPDPGKLISFAAAPLVKSWFSAGVMDGLGNPEADCNNVFVVIEFAVGRAYTDWMSNRDTMHVWHDALTKHAYEGQTPTEFFRSNGFRSLMHHVLSMHRLCLHTQEFLATLALVHGERCFFPALRDALGPASKILSDMSAEVNRIEMAAVYKQLFSFWDQSLDVLRHVVPIWNVMGFSTNFVNQLLEARVAIEKLRDASRDLQEDASGQPVAEPPVWHDNGGAFSDMHFLVRQMTDAWVLDEGLLASLVRLWTPPDVEVEVDGGDDCHTSIVDFGAGGGHYCAFLNKTGEYCCHAFDGSPAAPKHTGGAVQTARLDEPLDLGRTFDWVLCLEVAEHVPRMSEHHVLANLRRHARRGLVLSWSEHGEGPHANARPWHEVRQLIEGVGFMLDDAASARLRPRVSWLKGAVHVFRLPG